jgi:hypothetical protein
MDKKPNVFPKVETNQSTVKLSEQERIAQFEAEKKAVTQHIYEQSKSVPLTHEELPNDYNVNGHSNAVEMMRLRTQQQMYQKEMAGMVQDPSLAEKTTTRVVQKSAEQRNEEQMRLRDEQLRINQENIQKYQQQANQAAARDNKSNYNTEIYPQNNNQGYVDNSYVPPTPPSKPPVNTMENYGENPSNINPQIIELSQPNYNAPFDVIPLPSKGKLYKNKKPNIKVAYMTTADENILTSPNLLQSGDFLEILINRKILEPGIRYKDLTVGDRNAIMIWLRATAYGEMYPVTLLDENEEFFDTEVNLNDLKTIELNVEPDFEGYFDFTLPISKANIKFKFLTISDIDALEEIIKKEQENNVLINNSTTYRLERQIIEVNGNRDRNYIRDFANTMRIADAKALNDYIDSIESGIDLNIEVTTPGGGSIATFLPLTTKFFWPNF